MCKEKILLIKTRSTLSASYKEWRGAKDRNCLRGKKFNSVMLEKEGAEM
jgi:hypothetical protein